MSVEGFLAKAESRLVAAARDLDAGDVERSIGASYYAMFYAASAAHAVMSTGPIRARIECQYAGPKRVKLGRGQRDAAADHGRALRSPCSCRS